tara:strand:+ start:272 stop:1927 length:1656 start_codon:yes stop_codon:yes gene_type:complete
MAKIENTTVYPLTTPSVDDFIIGTDTSDENRTVSFSIESITATSLLQGLQSVLDAGHIATQDISLTGNITVVGTVYPTTITAQGSTGTAGQLLSSTATGIQWIDSAAAQDLESVLTVGNTTTLDINMNGSDIITSGSIGMTGAAQGLSLINSSVITLGANCSITTDDDIRLNLPTCVLDFNAGASISDGNNSLGTSGQIFTRGPAGVEWSTGIPSASMPTLQEVLTSGNSASGIGMAFTGSSTTTFAVGSTIQSFAPNQWQATNTYHASGTTLGTAGINLIGSLSDGTVGTGTTDQVLTSTVTGVQWKDVSAVGVSSVNNTTPVAAASPQTPITITPTSGAVLVRQNIYNGGSLIGCVPDGGTNSTFLRGDGLWATPAPPPPEWVTREPLTSNKVTFVGGSYYANVSPGSAGFPLSWAFELSASPAISALPDENFVTSLVASNIGNGACSSSYPNHQLCQATYNMVSDNADTYTFELWKVDLSRSVGVLAASVAIAAAANTMYEGDLSISTGSGQNILEPDTGYLWTVRPTVGTVVSSVYFNASFKWTGVA